MIAIIPARGGSKGLPGKNIIQFCGKPLIAHTIEAALSAKHIDRVIVSTDDQEIAGVAQEFGAEVPFLRPSELSTDDSLAINVYRYIIRWLMEESGAPLEAITVLLPTAPMRKATHIDEAIEIFNKKQAQSVISVKEFYPPVQWALEKQPDGSIATLFADLQMKNRQDEVGAFCPNGAIYVFSASYLLEHESYYGDKTYPYIMSEQESVDIDTELDLKWGEFLMQDQGFREV